MAEGGGGPNLHSLGLLDVKTDKNAPAKSLEDIITGALDRMVGGIAKVGGLNFVGSLLNTGVTKAYETAGYASKMVNENAANFGTRGGALAEAVMGEAGLNLAKFDFSKLVSPEVTAPIIEAFAHLSSDVHQGSHMSFGELGMISPMSTPSGGRGGESMGVG